MERKSLEEKKSPLRPASPRRRRKMKRYTITVNNPESGEELELSIPSYKKCRRSRRRKHKKIYCGDKEQVPRNYERKGTPYECLKKGYGSGLCGVYNSD